MSPAVFAAAGWLLAAAPVPPVDPQAAAVLEAFFQATTRTRAVTYVFDKTERLRDGRVTTGRYAVKQRLPHTLYVKAPSGREILFAPERDPLRLWVNPATFPFVTMRLDYRGDLATKDEHHAATHMGFHYLAAVLKAAMKTATRKNTGERFAYDGKSQLSGRAVKTVVFYAGHAPPEPIATKEGETLLAFGERVGADPYWIAYNDPSLPAALSAVLPLRDVPVPRYYGRRTELAFDAKSGLLVRQTTWDEQGRLYERYLYEGLEPSAALAALDFDPENPAYGF